jgi:hypothetical protein
LLPLGEGTQQIAGGIELEPVLEELLGVRRRSSRRLVLAAALVS